MNPQDFFLKLSVPNDPAGVDVVVAVARHAATYANIESSKGAAFVDRARAAATLVLTGGTPSHCAVTCAADQGQLMLTMGGQTVSEPLPA